MKIAFIDNLQVGGGLSRFSLKLCDNLIAGFSDVKIDYYIHEANLLQIPEIKTLGERVKVIVLKTTKNKSKAGHIVDRAFRKLFRRKLSSDESIKEIEQRIGKQYDLAYFPCAHMMKMPELSIPSAATIHDFNWRYFFGAEIFGNKFAKMMDSEIKKWLTTSFCISSSNDVVNEAKLMYPGLLRYPEVIPIAQVVVKEEISSERADEILASLDINYPYIIFPGHFFPHKNHLNLFTAFYLLKKDPAFKAYKLILAGVGTDKVERAKATYTGIRKILNAEEEYDIMGMGYQPNEVLDTLILKADLLVSPSIYEAICTPAMDAWSFATPTAISDIPPFREHESNWGIKTAFFDPMNPHDIAGVIAKCLTETERIKAEARVSQEKLSLYSWDKIVTEYMNVFKKAIAS